MQRSIQGLLNLRAKKKLLQIKPWRQFHSLNMWPPWSSQQATSSDLYFGVFEDFFQVSLVLPKHWLQKNYITGSSWADGLNQRSHLHWSWCTKRDRWAPHQSSPHHRLPQRSLDPEDADRYRSCTQHMSSLDGIEGISHHSVYGVDTSLRQLQEDCQGQVDPWTSSGST